MIIKNREGKKMYPVCSWNANQHKLYYWHDKAYLKDDYDEMERLDTLIDVFNSGVRSDGLVYAEWKYVQQIKEAIVSYDLRH